MSRAFVKEDVDVPERQGRRRSASGLPPGAINYITARGAARLRDDAARLRSAGDTASAGEIDAILASATVVEPSPEVGDLVTFGATVTVESADGQQQAFQIVGVDETDAAQNCVSWVSPIGRALLGAELGDRVLLPEGEKVTIARIDPRG